MTGLPKGLAPPDGAHPSAITGTPAAGDTSSHITVTVGDRTGSSVSRPYTLTVQAISISPRTLPVAVFGRPYLQPLTATGGSSPYTWSVSGLPSGLQFDDASVAIKGTPAATAQTAAVTIAVRDSASQPHQAQTTLQLIVNQPPTAPPVVATTHVGTSITIPLVPPAADSDGDPVTVTGVGPTAPPTAATLTHDNRSVTVMPTANFLGTARFPYTVSDGTLTANGTVSVTTTDDGPSAAPATATAHMGAAVTVPLVPPAADPDGDTVTVTAVGASTRGSVTHDAKSVTFTPNALFVDTASFTYTVSDGVVANTGQVNISYTDAPPSAPSVPATAHMGKPITVGLVPPATDPDGDPVTVTAVNFVSLGGATHNATSVTYTPNSPFTDTVSFSYTVSDGLLTSVGQVSINYTDSPPTAPAASGFNNGGCGTVQIFPNPTDPDNDPLTITSITQPAAGTAAIVSSQSGGGFTAMEVDFSPPSSTFTGSETFSYTVSDGMITATGNLTATVGPNTGVCTIQQS